MDTWKRRFEQTPFLLLGLVFLIYLAGADIGHALHAATAPTLIWPPAGFALAAVLLGGYSMLAAVGLAEFVFIFFVSHDPLLVALGLAAASVFQTLLAAHTLKQLGFHTGLGRLRDSFMLVAVAVGGAAVLPTLGSLIFWAGGIVALPSISSTWGTWYVGELLSLLVITPLLIRWLPKMTFHRSHRDWVEIAIAIVITMVLSILLFWTPFGIIDGVPLIYFLLMPLIWISLRMGPRIMTATLFAVSAIALSGTIANTAPKLLGDALFSIELLLSILAIIFLILVGLAEERKNVTVALRKQLVRLEDALTKIRQEDQAKSDFLAVLAHELRNPLAPLLSSLELLRLESDSSSKTRETINAMRGRVRTMARLLDDLLDITRITHGKLTLRPEECDVVAIVRRSAETVESEMHLRRHEFSVALPKAPIMATVDPVRIEQVVVNLLNNAAKYTTDGGTVALALMLEGREAVIRVKDTGVGVSREMRDRIFEPFRQGEPAQRMSTGLGVGLALAKSLVELHDGRISVESAGPNQGSEFKVRLPLHALRSTSEPGEDEKSRAIKNIRSAKRGLKVLIVDDNRDAADALAKLLAHIGHKPKVAYDGASGIALAAKWPPEVAILDIGLPDMEGYELARRLRQSGLTVPLIALTGYGQKEDQQKALAAGFDHHLTKPVGLTDIEAILRKLVLK